MIEGKATLKELDTYYSIDDVADMNDALDAWTEAKNRAEEEAAKKAEQEAKRKR